jgi:hypothetical protein
VGGEAFGELLGERASAVGIERAASGQEAAEELVLRLGE